MEMFFSIMNCSCKNGNSFISSQPTKKNVSCFSFFSFSLDFSCANSSNRIAFSTISFTALSAITSKWFLSKSTGLSVCPLNIFDSNSLL